MSGDVGFSKRLLGLDVRLRTKDHSCRRVAGRATGISQRDGASHDLKLSAGDAAKSVGVNFGIAVVGFHRLRTLARIIVVIIPEPQRKPRIIG